MIKNAPDTKTGKYNTDSWRCIQTTPYILDVKLDKGARVLFDLNGSEILIIAIYPAGKHDEYERVSTQISDGKFRFRINNDLNIMPYIPHGLTSQIAL